LRHTEARPLTGYLADVFGSDGFFARKFQGYEARPGQVALAQTVDDAMSGGKHALGEGPCGTGKGIAYLVPAIWHAVNHGKRTVVATANIALQEQLVKKDLPLLREVLPWPFTFALYKGKNNYLCPRRLSDSELGGLSSRLQGEELRQFEAISVWARRTGLGDVSELPFVPLPRVWQKCSTTPADCEGPECEFRKRKDDPRSVERCPAAKARALASVSDIVVTNFHMLFADVSLRQKAKKSIVLPQHDFLVCDEAHDAADVAREFFGFSVSSSAVASLARAASMLDEQGIEATLTREWDRFFGRVDAFSRSDTYRNHLSAPGFVPADRLVAALNALANAASPPFPDGLGQEAANMVRSAGNRARTMAEHIEEFVAQANAPERVYWIEARDGRVELRAKTVDVSGIFRDYLFGSSDPEEEGEDDPEEEEEDADRLVCPQSVVMVSATLTTGGTFEFVRKELGVPPDALEIVAESPFDFGRQALLVIPDTVPDPRDPEFVDALVRHVRRTVELCGGRTLGLFTSYKALNAVHEQMGDVGCRVLRQGELPRSELIRIFKEDVRSVLLGTESFWTGVDVPGESLTGLVIDKLPFPRPDDPVITAICDRDPKAFYNYLVPKAIMMLRQGVGRLIRTRTDVGVVVLLDRRLLDKAYGAKFLRSLPSMRRTRNLDEVAAFLSASNEDYS
jgi:ATP-dependent DNA helicase DinG